MMPLDEGSNRPLRQPPLELASAEAHVRATTQLGACLGAALAAGVRRLMHTSTAGLRATALGWGWQTFLLGFASLGLLEKRIARRAAAGRRREGVRA